ncbi:GAF domain-containing protein [Kineococcus xinjiangensis]|uniref:GAF domain-containing protein n=1 Tax=Kineococcus xinjiangensis TaxID=512762 RepID=A0A2S6IGP6_9ACTN|nr:GAF and ANTAR domain-containing protein [Kineococcus xinjiangensis]PPK93383.1 GAF domain-containing protein [Kineococcus xinjiangensis]
MPQLPPSATTALLGVRLGEGSLEDVLHQLVVIARDCLHGADEVSTTLVRSGRPWTAAHTGRLALDADELQYEHGYGPCIEAGLTGTVLLIEDTRSETRWPDYTAHVAAHGVRSSLSVPLPVQTEIVGALNCYSRKPGAFSDEDIAVAHELASHLAVAVGNAVAYTGAAQLAEQMRTAMDSRAVIDQAMGVIMAQNRCDAQAAFRILTRASQNRNVKLRDLAAGIVAGVAQPTGS